MGDTHRNDEVRAVDMEVGGDDDIPGIAQEMTTDDIDDIAFDPNLSVGERRERLKELRDELRMRRSGDGGDNAFSDQDMRGLFTHINDRLGSLDNKSVGDSELAAAGMDSDDRSDDDDPADHVDDEDEEARIEDLSRRRI